MSLAEALKRPLDFAEWSEADQWEWDKHHGILDWLPTKLEEVEYFRQRALAGNMRAVKSYPRVWARHRIESMEKTPRMWAGTLKEFEALYEQNLWAARMYEPADLVAEQFMAARIKTARLLGLHAKVTLTQGLHPEDEVSWAKLINRLRALVDYLGREEARGTKAQDTQGNTGGKTT